MTSGSDRGQPEPHPRYPSVFRPLRIAGVEIPNRIVRTAHGTGLARDGRIGSDLIEFHRERAEGDVGLTILELAPVHPTSASGGIRVYDDGVVDGYRALVKALAPYPMRVFQQLSHVGHNALLPESRPPWGASPVRNVQRDTAIVPDPMDVGQIEEIIGAFASAARRCADVGIHGVEVHAAHGHLLHQFLSPLTNQRSDRYGGSVENRTRFLREVLAAMRSAVGSGYPIGVRMSASELTPGGFEHGDVSNAVTLLESEGLIDFLDLSIGSAYSYHRVIGGMDEPHGYQLPHSLPIASKATVPTIVVGRVTSLDHAEEILRGGEADMVSMVRATIADGRVVARSRAGEPERVRPCIGCNQGCVGGNAGLLGHIGCVVNPRAGVEARRAEPAPTSRVRRVLVVGGGPAGMEAARVAALRGHQVTLHEAREELGGQVRLARRLPHHQDVGLVVDWMAQELRKLGVVVACGSRVDADLIADMGPEDVVIATGSAPSRDASQAARPLLAPIPGSDHSHVIDPDLLLEGTAPIATGTVAMVIDDVGHYAGFGIAEWLLDAGAEVVLVTGRSRLAPLMEPARAVAPMKSRVAGRAFTLVTDHVVERIDSGSVVVRSILGGPERTIRADLVVPVLPRRPVVPGLPVQRDDGPTIHVVGDARSPRFLQVAIDEGHRVGSRI